MRHQNHRDFKNSPMHLLAAITAGFITLCFPASAEKAMLRLATTTSVDHSGLLPYLLPEFEKKHSIKLQVIAVGTGKALRLGENGDVDALLVHAPEAEREFVSKGFGKDREEFMFNHFLIAGPKNDPARLNGCKNVKQVMKRLAAGKWVFISRADDSGTHKKELQLWKHAECKPEGDWYLEVGRGMGPALLMAEEKQAYILSDLGTYLAMKRKLELAVCYECDESMRNVYSVIVVNPARHPKVRSEAARQFARWILSPPVQIRIAEFKVSGETLFQPLRLRKEDK